MGLDYGMPLDITIGKQYLVYGKTYPPFVDSGMDVVTRNNVAAMIRAWETNDFSQPLPNPLGPGSH